LKVTTSSNARLWAPGIAVLGLALFAGLVTWFGIIKPVERDQAPAPAVAIAPVPSSGATEQERSPPAQASAPGAPAVPQAEAKAPPPATGEAKPAGADAAKPSGPSFDVVRVEPSGESVIAGRGAPGATIEMLRDGQSHARALADTSGLFALVPPPLPPGSHEITLQSVAPDGARAQSRESVTVVIGADRKTQPLVALTAPDRPTVVLSSPEPSPKIATAPDASAPAPQAANPAEAPRERPGVKIASVEAEEGGRLFVAGSAAAGATVRLYLNESFIAPGGVGGDGRVSFGIERGVKPGDYRVRLDEVDPVSGQVRSRAEVAFHVPGPLASPLPPDAQPAATALGVPLVSTPESSATAATSAIRRSAPGRTEAHPGRAVAAAGPSADAAAAPHRPFDPGTVVVPEVNTTIVARGESLWHISRRIYGVGTRYTVIYEANQKQIRNPDLIYPGQLFVLPPEQRPSVIP
jgi:nucleoid-associated protein YgaU